jgi:hypothetical protein
VYVASAISAGTLHPATTHAACITAPSAPCAIAQLFATADITSVIALVAAVARWVALDTAAVANSENDSLFSSHGENQPPLLWLELIIRPSRDRDDPVRQGRKMHHRFCRAVAAVALAISVPLLLLRHRAHSGEGAGSGGLAKAARMFSANLRSISLAFDLSTGRPMLPSLPVILTFVRTVDFKRG